MIKECIPTFLSTITMKLISLYFNTFYVTVFLRGRLSCPCEKKYFIYRNIEGQEPRSTFALRTILMTASFCILSSSLFTSYPIILQRIELIYLYPEAFTFTPNSKATVR
jgi:hypothetical protein